MAEPSKPSDRDLLAQARERSKELRDEGAPYVNADGETCGPDEPLWIDADLLEALASEVERLTDNLKYTDECFDRLADDWDKAKRERDLFRSALKRIADCVADPRDSREPYEQIARIAKQTARDAMALVDAGRERRYEHHTIRNRDPAVGGKQPGNSPGRSLDSLGLPRHGLGR